MIIEIFKLKVVLLSTVLMFIIGIVLSVTSGGESIYGMLYVMFSPGLFTFSFLARPTPTWLECNYYR